MYIFSAVRSIVLVFQLALFAWLSLQPLSVVAQPCNGSKGANIFTNGDFGSGTPNIVPVDPGIAPGYQYITNPPPFDGEYTITNDMGAWGNRLTWLPLQDYSTDPNGYFMVVNASVSPGLFYEETVTGLCENTTYEFTADLVNLLTPGTNQLQPNVSFVLDNVVQYTTGAIPETGIWTTYGFTFTTLPGQTSLTLALRNNAPGGIGNDLGIDNISFRACGPTATIVPGRNTFCIDELPITITRQLTNNTYPTPLFQWQTSADSGKTWTNIPGANDTSFTPTINSGGVYWFRYAVANSPSQLTNPNCRVLSTVKQIRIVAKDYRIEDTICTGTTYDFGNRTLTVSGTYADTFVTAQGCDSIVTLTLTTLPNNVSPQFIVTPATCDYIANAQVQLDTVTGGTAPYIVRFQGDTLTTGQTLAALAPGNYTFTVQDNIGCEKDTTIQVPPTPPFTVNLGPDRTGVVGDTFTLYIQSNSPIAQYSWTPDSLFGCTDNCSPITIQPSQSTTVVLVATSVNGCITTDTLQINLTLEQSLFFPNAFSPNGDGLNDIFGAVSKYPMAQEIESLMVYNRWGELAYNGLNLPVDKTIGWDGKIDGVPAQAGAYTYVARVRFLTGATELYNGYVVLLR